MNLFTLMSLMSCPNKWFGKLFHSLIILRKKEYLKALILADFVWILNGWLALVFNILLRTGTLVDAEVSSNLVICIVRMASHGVFAQERFLMLLVVLFQWLAYL